MLPGRAILACDLFSVEHATRRIRILGVTLHPTREWKFMIRDRGSNFTAAFDAVLADAGIRTMLCNVRTPRMNAITERWIGGGRRELLDRTLVWNQAHLLRILRDYEAHQPGSPGALLHRGPLRTGHARSRAPRPRQAARAVQVVCCSTVFPARRGGCLLRWQVACTRCVL